MTSVAVMQPYLFPYIGYFQLLDAVDTFVVFDDVHYIKRGWINRNSILLNGEAHQWTLPVAKASQNRLINDHALSEPEKHKPALLALFRQAYAKAPQFAHVYPLLESILHHPEINLAAFITHSLQRLSEYMGMNTHILCSSDMPKNPSSPAQQRIIQMVQHLGGTHYINAAGGKELYDASAFGQEGITLSFIQTGNICYPQGQNTFTPYLSIVDMLMFNEREMVQSHIKNYSLVT